MRRSDNASDFVLRYRRCRDSYNRIFAQMVATIRAKFASGADTAVDESLEAHLRAYVINDLLRALNWNMGVAPEAGLPNLVPEAPIWSAGTESQRFLDYLGVERGDCERPLLIVETKRPSASLPQPRGSRRRNMEPAEAIRLGLQGKELSGDWSEWLTDLRDYVRAVAAKTGTMPKKAVITNGEWIIIFSDPQDSFAVDGDIAIGKILVFEDEAAIDREYPTLFEQLEYSRLSNVREPISACEVGYCVRPGNVAKVMRGIQLLYIENPGIYDPPSPFIKVVPLLFLGSSTGEWLCVKGPDDIEMPSRTEHIPGHIFEIEQVSAKLIADCEAVLGELPSPMKLADHFASGLDVLPGVREVRRNMYLVLTGEQPHYFREQPSVSNCRFHDWKQAQDDGVASPPAVWGRSVDPRTFFYSGESQHCAHANVTELKRSAISAENRSECGPRSGRNGEAFCEIWSFDTRLCCRTCAFETACTSSRIFALPCAPSLTTVGQPDGSIHGPAKPRSELVPLRSRTDLPRQGQS